MQPVPFHSLYWFSNIIFFLGCPVSVTSLTPISSESKIMAATIAQILKPLSKPNKYDIIDLLKGLGSIYY